ncbi:glycosyltransferase family 4 protein [Rhodohalobacter sulfatireducens]|uniref:Glycosyltransferase family 4 protein n=1 Tax=Rhodohalobacter sulfatireducens TaxID=2911366 RepID=A0ABS9KA64_9BACT|nr:glycosyltransferase family 1 protein [Rhodohalobacter sulfatireducens]MCG2587741.1 glycosyltransferase family 4 protein [Rhodohalobacter sulfatireducens]
MKILYDHQIFTMQQEGGISRYFSELISELSEFENIEIQTSIKYSENRYLSNIENKELSSFLPKRYFKGKVKLQSFLNRYSSKQTIVNSTFDLFHPTFYDTYFLSKIGEKPMVVTVHDMIHERLPHYFSNGSKISDHKREVIERADKIIAISKHTKDDLIDLFGVNEQKIDVIYQGSSLIDEYRDTNVDLEWLPKKYILFVGIRSAYKNFQKFLESVSPLLVKDEDLHLVCVGGGKFQKSEQSFLASHELEEKAIQISCTDSELAHIYKNARCFVFPTLYEGFGLPILEAFAANCPVVCSKCASLPEVAGDAAIYFDPKSEKEIREAVRKVVYDDDLRKDLIQKGVERTEKFSWRETARQTKEVYESLL